MHKYQNREAAGIALAQELLPFAKQNDVLVLALPRGGVPVGYQIAKALHAPLDVFIVRKLGVPGHTELAMGAIASGGVTVFNDNVLHMLNVSQDEIHRVKEKELQELQRREVAYREDMGPLEVKGKVIILVDDGIATGATIRAAIKALRQMQADKIIVAVPVAAEDTCLEIQTLVDGFICPMRPTQFYAVGLWYDEFLQTEDEEVYALLKKARNLVNEE